MSITLPAGYQEALVYDETSPTYLRWKRELIRKDGRAHKCPEGRVAGFQVFNNRYGETLPKVACVGYANKLHRIHLIVWEMHFGKVPSGKLVDHIDGNPLNNNIKNLRLADVFENAWNARRSTRNTSGVKGVYYCVRQKKWVAEITKSKKKTRIGSFESLDAAREAVAVARRELHQEFARNE